MSRFAGVSYSFRDVCNVAEFDLKATCHAMFGGVGAMSPELFEKSVQRLATMAGREADRQFRIEVNEILTKIPCSLD